MSGRSTADSGRLFGFDFTWLRLLGDADSLTSAGVGPREKRTSASVCKHRLIAAHVVAECELEATVPKVGADPSRNLWFQDENAKPF